MISLVRPASSRIGRRAALAALLPACLLALPERASSQVFRELAPVELEYVILWGKPVPEIVGAARVSFSLVDTKRGRRLEVKSKIEYTLPRATPFDYSEECTLICDDEGVFRFDSTARAIGKERVNSAIRVGDDFHLTTRFDGKTTRKTITAGVKRTNFGLFAGGFLATPLNEGRMMDDFPLLYPVGGDHEARQRVREGVLPFDLGNGRMVRAIQTIVRRPNEVEDRIVNAVEGHQILLRMEERSTLGLMIYELTGVNGQPLFESEHLR